jgi:hypothetical protein
MDVAATVKFSEYEQEVIHFLAKRYSDEGNLVFLGEFPRFEELGRDKIVEVAKRLARLQMVEWHTNERLEIFPNVLAVANQLDNPPLRDYWDEATKRFRSKRWSLLVLGLVFGLPAAITWIGMLKTFLEWFGIVKGK